MTRRLILCLDGTWNTTGDHTNVSRIHAATKAIPDGGPRGDAQLKYYDEGVGTHWYDRIRGGMLGSGLSRNVRQAYAWLIQHYRPDSQIFLFGFSRGAYTARSLAGLIKRCGIPPRPAREVEQSSDILAQQAYSIYRASKSPDRASRDFTANHSQPAAVYFIGVWDTVGALGIPLVNLDIAERFHDTTLGDNVAHAYQALAIDEHRKDYKATLWTANPGDARVEQRWFPGAHANIGGGYRDDLLPDISLAWIATKAVACGLSIDEAAVQLDGGEYRTPVRDSFGEFMFGLYRCFKLGQRHYRPIGHALNETVDESAFRKWAADQNYRPRNLAHASAQIATPQDNGAGARRAPAARRRSTRGQGEKEA
jgi:uncharacterized protein (DUF2235 family)